VGHRSDSDRSSAAGVAGDGAGSPPAKGVMPKPRWKTARTAIDRQASGLSARGWKRPAEIHGDSRPRNPPAGRRGDRYRRCGQVRAAPIAPDVVVLLARMSIVVSGSAIRPKHFFGAQNVARECAAHDCSAPPTRYSTAQAYLLRARRPTPRTVRPDESSSRASRRRTAFGRDHCGCRSRAGTPGNSYLEGHRQPQSQQPDRHSAFEFRS
jgi:hypothetical protein